MKAIFLLVVVVAIGSPEVMAQSGPFVSEDSARIELERKTISTELEQLRDSIQISILAFDARLRKSSSSQKEKRMLTARQKLNNFRNQLTRNQNEISTTGQNSWNTNSLGRIRQQTGVTRREYKRILHDYRHNK